MESLREVDFITKLYFLNAEQGGRASVVSTRYRPHIKFSHSQYLTTGELRFLDKSVVYPGEIENKHASIATIGPLNDKYNDLNELQSDQYRN